jgi:hypothetical protein
MSFFLVGLIVLIFAGYLVWSVLRSWLVVKAAPREPMIFCAKHGPIREQYTIDFMGTKNCAICFHDRLKLAERGRIA